jgi:hypothetical protein
MRSSELRFARTVNDYAEGPECEAPVTPVRSPKIDFTQETRFAVVMYGGVSLAIYMNGVAQELLKLVRATAAGLTVNGEQRAALGSGDYLCMPGGYFWQRSSEKA